MLSLQRNYSPRRHVNELVIELECVKANTKVFNTIRKSVYYIVCINLFEIIFSLYKAQYQRVFMFSKG